MHESTIVLHANSYKFHLNFNIDFANSLVQRGHTVYLCCPSSDKIHALRSCFPNVITYSSSRNSLNLFFFIISILNLYRVLKDISPDVLHNFTNESIIKGSIVSRFRRVLLINEFTGLGYLFTNNTRRNSLIRLIFFFIISLNSNQRTKLVFLNSTDLSIFNNILLLKGFKKFLINGVGVDIEYFSPLNCPPNRNPFRILLVSRLLYDKGLDIYINLARKFLGNKNFEFFHCGPVDLNSPTSINRDLFEEALKLDNLTFYGHLPKRDLRELYRNSNVLLLPSKREGLSTVIIEAMAIGLPIITFDVPGCKDLVIDDGNGFLVDYGDIEGLSTGLRKLHDSESLYYKFCEKSRELAVNIYNTDVVFKSRYDLYCN